MKLLKELLQQLNEKKSISRTDLAQRPKSKSKKNRGRERENYRAGVADKKFEDGDGA